MSAARTSAAAMTTCAVLTVALALAGCAGTPAGPPRVQWGVDECGYCHMILSDSRSAAVARNETGEEVRFDDLGCAASFFAAANGGAGRWQTWVHAVDDERWLDAEQAWVVRFNGRRTPMGSGLAAYASEPAARAAAGAAAGATPQRWTALLTQPNRLASGGAP